MGSNNQFFKRHPGGTSAWTEDRKQRAERRAIKNSMRQWIADYCSAPQDECDDDLCHHNREWRGA